MPASALDDPRARSADGDAGDLYALCRAAVDAATAAEANALRVRLRDRLAALVERGDGGALAAILDSAPSPAVARHLRRLFADIETEAVSIDAVATVLFAIPVVIVAALEASVSPLTLDAILPDPAALAALLRDARAFGGCETFALSSSLVAVDAIDAPALPALLARVRASSGGPENALALELAPAPIAVDQRDERVHLRFVPGALLAPAGVDPLRDTLIGKWGMPFARMLVAGLRAPGVVLLALPRPPQRLVGAVQAGRAAQREISAQLFASSAIRRLRASYGEPRAIISAHRAGDAPGRAELRLSLSSPFAATAAEGFRCPVYPYETVQEVGEMLGALLRDCRLTDVRFVAGAHPDIDPATGGPLFFKEVAEAPEQPLH